MMTRIFLTMVVASCVLWGLAGFATSAGVPVRLDQYESALIRGGAECMFEGSDGYQCLECLSDQKCNSVENGADYECEVLTEGPCECCTTTEEQPCGGDLYQYESFSECQGEATYVDGCPRKKDTYSAGTGSGTCPNNCTCP